MNDRVLSEEIRRNEFRFIPFIHDHFKDFQFLIQEKKISKDFLNLYSWLAKHHNLLCRGVSHHNYDLVRRYGNDKTWQDSSPEEIHGLREKDLQPEDILYAAPYLEKAWEFVIRQRERPAILLVYDEQKLQRVEGQWYMWRLKPGYHSFLQALEAMVFVYFT